MLSASKIILEWICPSLGVIMANIMFLAPVKPLREAVARGHLGDLNPAPWAFMLGNCLGWIAYSFLLQNLFVFFANAPGFLLSVWYNLGAAKLLYQTHKAKEIRKSLVAVFNEEDRNTNNDDMDIEKFLLQVTTRETQAPPAHHEYLVVVIVVIWTLALSILGFATSFEQRTKELIVGFLVNINVMFFYGAPLSTIITVVRMKSSNSILIPTMISNTMNAVFWTAYGLAVSDGFIYVPNGMGTIFGGCQIVLILLFPRNKEEDMSADKGNVTPVESPDQSELGITTRSNATQQEEAQH